jgi:hypothetical protein
VYVLQLQGSSNTTAQQAPGKAGQKRLRLGDFTWLITLQHRGFSCACRVMMMMMMMMMMMTTRLCGVFAAGPQQVQRQVYSCPLYACQVLCPA